MTETSASFFSKLSTACLGRKLKENASPGRAAAGDSSDRSGTCQVGGAAATICQTKSSRDTQPSPSATPKT